MMKTHHTLLNFACSIMLLILFAGMARADNQETVLSTNQTLTANTPVFLPAGAQALDASWLLLATGTNQANQFYALEICLDSTNGYSAPCSLTVEVYCGSAKDDSSYIVSTYSTTTSTKTDGLIVWQGVWTSHYVPSDTCRHIPIPMPLARHHRYRIYTSDTCILKRFQEIEAR